jgi:hypothetical protein
MITYKLDPTLREFIAAHYLHHRPSLRPIFKVLGVTLLLIFIMVFVMRWLYPSRFDTSDFVLVIFIGLLILQYGVILPLRVKKSYYQNKFHQHETNSQLDDAGIHIKSDLGENHIPWDHFIKWKENKSLIIIYITDLQFLVIPKRCLGSAATVNEVLLLIGNKINKKV